MVVCFWNLSAHAMTTVSFQDGVSPNSGYSGTEDSYGRSTSPNSNFGSETSLLADGVTQDPDNGVYGKAAIVIKWDVSSIPVSATVTSASITFDITDSSSGVYNLVKQNGGWTEATVGWSDLNPSETALGNIAPLSSGVVTINLNGDGITLVQGWVDGTVSNDGLVIQSGGTNNSIRIASRESTGFHPKLEVTYMEETPTLEEMFVMIQQLQSQMSDLAQLQTEMEETPTIDELVAMIENLQGQVDPLNQLRADLAGVKRVGDTIQFEGVNLQVINGLGATNGDQDDGNGPQVNGLGNLIVGYDEGAQQGKDKTGSHNIVVGPWQSYSSYGGLVAGSNNKISAPYSTITGGSGNFATGRNSNVAGGTENIASGPDSSVSGGSGNNAVGQESSVFGGNSNSTEGPGSTISGGIINRAVGNSSTISGGWGNIANGYVSHISGGYNNTIADTGEAATVGGGANRTASGYQEWVAGSLSEPN